MLAGNWWFFLPQVISTSVCGAGQLDTEAVETETWLLPIRAWCVLGDPAPSH